MMPSEAFSIPFDQVLLSTLLIAIFSFIVVVLSSEFKVPLFLSLILLYWHVFFTIVYFFYVSAYGGDAYGYYEQGLNGIEYGLGGEFVRALVFILYAFGLSFFSMFLVFGFVGYLGVFLIFSAFLKIKMHSKKMYWVVVVLTFMPSLHFWSSAVGKDVFSFFALGLIIYSCVSRKYKYLFFSGGLIFMLLVRPHMAAIIMASGFIGYVVSSKVIFPLKLALSTIMLVAGMSLVPFFFSQAGLDDDAEISDVSQYVEMRQTKNLQGTTSIDIANMSVPGRLFSYLFRPSLLDGGGALSIITALDNAIILLVFLSLLVQFREFFFSGAGWNIMLLAYFLIAWIVLANTTANLGISVRQKWMFVPCLYFFMVSIHSRRFYGIENEK